MFGRRGRRAAQAAASPALPQKVSELTRTQKIELYGWMQGVANGNLDAEQILVTIKEHFEESWSRLLVLVMALDDLGIRGDQLVQLFNECERDILQFESKVLAL